MSRRVTAGVLALILGGLGAHKFYVGKWLWGLTYVVFCWTFIPAVVALFEGVRYFSMTDNAFDVQYGPTQIIVGTGGVVQATPDTHVKCPDCRELVFKDARKCKHCGAALVPQA